MTGLHTPVLRMTVVSSRTVCRRPHTCPRGFSGTLGGAVLPTSRGLPPFPIVVRRRGGVDPTTPPPQCAATHLNLSGLPARQLLQNPSRGVADFLHPVSSSVVRAASLAPVVGASSVVLAASALVAAAPSEDQSTTDGVHSHGNLFHGYGNV